MENNLLGGNFSQHENVDDDGNYNLQVLAEALKIYGIELQALKSSEAIKLLQKNMDSLEAFIFNSSTHWFAIRKIDGIWFNLNSTNSFPGPEIISDFYLSAFLQGTEDIGYTNFLVKKIPALPDLQQDMYKNLQTFQKLVTLEDVMKAKESKKINKDKENQVQSQKEDEKKFNAFSGKGTCISNEDVINKIPSQFEDDEMKQAYQLSLDEYILDLQSHLPKEPEKEDEIYNIMIKYSDQTFNRKFSINDKIYVIFNL
jgi:ataxin-3